MQDDLAGKALYPLADLVSAADFPLSVVIADQTRYAALFARFYYSDVDFYFQDDAPAADVELIVEGALAIPLPGLDDCQLRFMSPIPGWTHLRGSLMLGAAPICTIHEASITLELPSAILSDVAAGGRASVTLSSGILISSSGLNLVNVAGATLPPSRLLGTDIIVQARGVRPLLGQGGTDDVLPAMTGVEFDQLSLEIPLSFIARADQTRLVFDTDAARIDSSGFSGSLHVTAQDFPTVLGGRCLALPFEFRQLHFDVESNRLDAFSITIALRLPALEEQDTPAWMSVTLDLDRNNQVLTAGLEAPLILGLGRDHVRPVRRRQLRSIGHSRWHADLAERIDLARGCADRVPAFSHGNAIRSDRQRHGAWSARNRGRRSSCHRHCQWRWRYRRLAVGNHRNGPSLGRAA
jgi:hypothetical protein